MVCQKFCRLSSMPVTRKSKTSHIQACGPRKKRLWIIMYVIHEGRANRQNTRQMIRVVGQTFGGWAVLAAAARKT
jgi:hypothetical protein